MVQPELDLSFVVPTHNRVDLLAETIRSILNQTRRAREIIVVDNGTENRAASALAEFGDQVRLIKSAPNQKQLARNAGIGAAASTWVATLDDDDLLRPDYLEHVERAIADGRADIIGADHRKFRGDIFDARTKFEDMPAGYWDGVPQPENGESWSFVGDFPLEKLLRRIPIYPSMMVIRREFALRIGGFDPRMLGIPSEDLEFLIRALAHGRLALIWRPLVNYRQHSGNDTASAVGREIGRWRIFEFVRHQVPGLPPQFLDALDRNLFERRVQVYELAFRAGDYPLMTEVEAMLRPQDWTLRQSVRRRVAMLPPSMARALRSLVIAPKRLLGRVPELS